MEKTIQELFFHLAERGFQGRIMPIQHVEDLQEEITGRREQGLFDADFYQERLTWFDFNSPASLPGAASLIVVAVPRPQTRVSFTWNGLSRSFILPPTYAEYRETQQLVEELLTGILAPAGFHVTPPALPLKLLAARSGLGQYGKNNICYVPGMGSFHQLTAVYSDLPAPDDGWQEAQMMERCRTCNACLHKCPTGAISSDRFLLHADKCLVFHNERPASAAFPSWIDPAWHNCLMGCMDCQRVCPEDKPFMQWVENGQEFSQEETAILLKGTRLEQLSAATAEKLKRLNLADDVELMPRNLGVLLAR